MIISAAFTTVSKVVDALWSQVTLLVKNVGVGRATNNTFYDDGPYNFSPTRNGDVTQGSFSPFGPLSGDADPNANSGSVYFNRADAIANGTGSYLTVADNAAIRPGAGDFTIELWFNMLSVDGGTYNMIYEKNYGGGNLSICTAAGGRYLQVWGVNGSTPTITASTAFTLGVWNHVAVVRSGSTMTMYLNGASVGSATDATDYSGTSPLHIGGNSSFKLETYVSNVRMVKGTAVYTGNFTVPRSPLTAIAGTGLLTCQSSLTITDASSNAFSVIKTGSPRTDISSPVGTVGYGSVYFDGSGDYLSIPSSTAVAYGTGDFTVEFWAYPTSSSGSLFVSGYNGTAVAGVNVGITNSTSLWWLFGNGSAWDFERRPTYTLSMNTWHHFAVTRESGTAKLYVDGVLVDSVANTTNFGSSAWYVGASASAGYNITGNVSNLRVVKGSAVYTGSSFAVPTAPLTAISGTSLLTCQDKGSIVDASTNSFTVSRVGDAKPVGMTPFAQKQAGYWSNYFDGSGDYLTVPSNSAWAFGTGAFTVELWINPQSWPSTTYAPLIRTVGGTNGFALFNNGGNLVYHIPNVGDILSASLPATGSWSHIALCRSGTTVSMFVNGTRVATATNSTNQAAANIAIGGSTDWNTYVNAHISNVRVVKGSAVYDPTSATLTVPSAPLTAISGTSLLTCQDNRFKDNSSNNATLTRTGDVSVSRFNPFGQTMPAPTVNLASAGSVYFDGSGDGLYVSDNANLRFESSDFTVEFWWKPDTFAGSYDLYHKGYTFAGGFAMEFGAGYLVVYCSGATTINANITSSAVLGAWNHIAVVRNSGTVTLYINGVSVASGTYTGNLNNTGTAFIGCYNVSGQLCVTGNMSNVRLVKGTAVYTGNFTPSTSPLTAIAGTSLLTAQDSVTITDASSNNFTVTKVGDAKAVEASPFKRVSTVYGGSAYFDGTGDWLTVKDNPSLRFGTGDFTIEYWMNGATVPSGNVFIMDKGENGTGSFRIQANSGQTTLLVGGTPLVYVNPAPFVGSWYHVAFVRSGATLSAYLNGVKASTVTNSTDMSSTADLTVGGTASGTTPMNGYLAGVRLVKGVAVYTANFDPPVAPVSAVGGTSLLLNFDNAGIYDASGNNDMQTVGDTKTSTAVTKFSPGASTYFDGTGDWLTIPDNPGLRFGTGSFTLEFWWYPTSLTGYRTIMGKGYVGTGELLLQTGNGDGKVLVYASGSVVLFSSTAVTVNTWNHVAVVRDGTAMALYINGASTATATNSTNINTTAVFQIGDSYYGATSNYPTVGYIQDVRVTKGAARYTTTFTPPATEFPTTAG